MTDERYDEMVRDMHADIMADAPKCACCDCQNPAGNCNAEDSYGRMVAVCEDCKRDLLTGKAKLPLMTLDQILDIWWNSKYGKVSRFLDACADVSATGTPVPVDRAVPYDLIAIEGDTPRIALEMQYDGDLVYGEAAWPNDKDQRRGSVR